MAFTAKLIKLIFQGKLQANEFDAKIESAVNKTPNSKQYLKQQDIETEEVQLLSPMVFSQPVNGHMSSSVNNDMSVLETDNGEITPLTKSQLSQVISGLTSITSLEQINSGIYQ